MHLVHILLPLYYKKFTDEPFTGTVDDKFLKGNFLEGSKDGKWIKLSIEYWLDFFNHSKEISTGWKGLDIIIFETNAAIPLTILAIIIIFIGYAITSD